MSAVPALRIRRLTESPPREDGRYVLYWMTATRRLEWNFALDRAIELAERHDIPLLVFEAIRVGYEWAADRHHHVILDGMREHRERLADGPVAYYAYVEPEDGAGSGLLAALAESARFVVTDDSPVFFTPGLLRAATRLEGVPVDAVDSCGLFPLHATDRTFSAAYHFRRYLHKTLPEHLLHVPSSDSLGSADLKAAGGSKGASLDDLVDESILSKWPPASDDLLAEDRSLEDLPIDHSIGRTEWRGGATYARERLDDFLENGLPRYLDRNNPDLDVVSGLSPALHYGHLSSHEIFDRITKLEEWSPARLSDTPDGRRKGWWGMSEPAEAFLDQFITWRELGYNYCTHAEVYDTYESLPEWARETMETHASDEREYVYTLEEFAEARTHDELWNAAQRQLLSEGVIHNYLRMLWGKKILDWTEDPRTALDIMIELNNRYANDGRDPNSYSGIFWTMGRFDRGWPEREVFGKVRSMTSQSTRRKVDLDKYLAKWGDSPELDLDGDA